MWLSGVTLLSKRHIKLVADDVTARCDMINCDFVSFFEFV